MLPAYDIWQLMHSEVNDTKANSARPTLCAVKAASGHTQR